MLRWESSRPPLPEPVVAAAEMILGRALPPSYRALVQAHPGGRPRRERRPGTEGWLSCVGWLMSLDPRHSENVFSTIGDLAIDEQLPDGLVPIIGDGGGNLICLDYRRSGGDPSVVYWQHELTGDEAIVPICASFDAFLAILEGEAGS